MKKLFFFIFLTACSSNNYDKIKTFDNINFDNDLTFMEFENLLIRYVKESNYPNID